MLITSDLGLQKNTRKNFESCRTYKRNELPLR
nr:MAG TPA: hypothetical protein [Crassvirales sp.]